MNSRMPASFELPQIRPLWDLGVIVCCKIPSVFIRIALPEMRRLVIFWSVVVVVQFEGSKTAPYVHD